MAYVKKVNGNIVVYGAKSKQEAQKVANEYKGSNASFVSQNEASVNAERSAVNARGQAQAEREKNIQSDFDFVVSGNKSRAREQAKQRAQLEKDVLVSEKKKAQAKEAEKKSMVGSSYAAAFQTREEEYKQAQERSSMANQEANEAKKRMETAQKERQAGYDAVRNRNRQRRENEIFQEGMAEIAAMPEADRAELERYANGKYAETVQRFTPGFDAPPVLQSDVDNRAQALFEKYGEQRVKELADVVRRSQNADMTEAVATQGAAFGENHGFLTNVAVSAGTGFLSGISGVADRAASAQLSSGIFDSPDANALGNVGSVFSGNIDEAYKKDKNGAVSLAYDVAKGIGEMGLQIAFGPASSAIMAARGFSDGYQTAVQNGANDAQAIAMGAGQAVLEAATEALPLDELLKVAKGGKQPFLQLIGNTIKQAGIESGTELTSMVGTWLWEYLVMGDDRSYNRSISDAVANGMSYEDAKAQADQNRVQEAVQTFAVSALTGGISYGATGAVTNVRTNNAERIEKKPQDIVNSYVESRKESEQPANSTQPEPVQTSTDQAFEAVAREINNPSPTVAERFAKKMTEEEVKKAFEAEFVPQSQSSVTSGPEVATEPTAQAVEPQTEAPEQKVSKLYENTMKRASDADIRAQAREIRNTAPEETMYTPQTEAQENAEAAARTDTPEKITAERDLLMGKSDWTPVDIKTSFVVSDNLLKSGDSDAFRALSAKRREVVTTSAQNLQALAEYTRRTTAAGAVETALGSLDTMGEAGTATSFYRKQGYEAWKKGVSDALLQVGKDLDSVKAGDTNGVKGIITDLAQFRHTTAWLGYSSKLTKATNRALNRMDFQELRQVAIKQLSSVPDDFRKRTAGEIVKNMWLNNMLASFKSVNRNVQSNVVGGLLDLASDNSFGRLADSVLANFTGIRTIGNELAHTGKALTAARDAWDFALMCIDLDIPMETDSKYGKGSLNTFSPQSGFIGRVLGAYNRYLQYGLGATDTVFEAGGVKMASEGVAALGKASGITPETIAYLGEYVGQRRTMKEDRNLAKGTRKLKQGLNQIAGIQDFGLGDFALRFDRINSNEIQTKIDYAGGGLPLGVKEMIDIAKAARELDSIKDSKAKEAKRQEYAIRQRKAVSDFGRGITGPMLIAALTAAAAKGLISYTTADDWDEENADANQNKRGTQINWSAMLRAFNSEDTTTQTDDFVTGVDSLGAFATTVSLATVFAQDDKSFANKAGESFMAIYDSILNAPFMDGFSNVQNILETLGDAADGDEEARATAFGGFIGKMASGAFPAFLRNAAHAVDPVYRDTSDSNPVQAGINKVKAGIPGLSQTLPAKIDPLTGRPQMRSASIAESAWNSLLAPDEAHRLKINETTEYLDGLASITGDDSIYPSSKAPENFTYSGKEYPVDGKQNTELYQQTYANAVFPAYRDLIDDPEFQELAPELQTAKFNEVLTQAKARAEAVVAGMGGLSEPVKKELLNLQNTGNDNSVLYEPPKQTITYTDKAGYSQERALTDEEHAKLAEQEKNTFDATMTALISSGKYQKLPGEYKTQAVGYSP